RKTKLPCHPVIKGALSMANADGAPSTTSGKAAGAGAVATPPKPEAKPAAPPKPASSSAQEIPDSGKMRRRIVWSCVWGFVIANFLMFLRFFFPRALFEPETVHVIGYPSDFQIGVNEKYKQAYRIWVVKEPPRLFCIFAKCTHLGCTPDWKPARTSSNAPATGAVTLPRELTLKGRRRGPWIAPTWS